MESSQLEGSGFNESAFGAGPGNHHTFQVPKMEVRG